MQLEGLNKILAAAVRGSNRRAERAQSEGVVIGLALGAAIYGAPALLVARLP